ncbi:hypothetical protein HAX54_007343 [Datura stramonium]|uniref:Uncharacterized protein n=1 Tax=Datura stramonium TaxID=4076 RepID=A0ABS8WUN7_DATST|nr:hypothetical protein [Datura stramonium]
MYPSINPNVPLSSIDGAGMDQALQCFCDTLKSVAAIWTGDNVFIMKLDEEYSELHNDLRRYGLVLLDEMIKLATERVFDMMDEDDQMRDESPSSDAFRRGLSESHSSNESSLSSPPPTPTSVLSSVISASQKSELKAQATEKLNPIDLKRLYLDLLPYAIAQDPNYAVQLTSNFSEQKSEIQEKLGSEVKAGDGYEFGQDFEMLDSPDILLTGINNVSKNGGTCRTDSSNNQPVSSSISLDVLLPPSTLPEFRSKVEEQEAAPLAPFTLSSNVIKSPSLTSRNIVAATSPFGPMMEKRFGIGMSGTFPSK